MTGLKKREIPIYHHDKIRLVKGIILSDNFQAGAWRYHDGTFRNSSDEQVA